jgi:hypothetical protein
MNIHSMFICSWYDVVIGMSINNNYFDEWEGKWHMTQLPGDQHITYQLQYRKCGKPTCRTCREGQGHGPYWYAYWREGLRLRSGYIGKVSPETGSVFQTAAAK